MDAPGRTPYGARMPGALETGGAGLRAARRVGVSILIAGSLLLAAGGGPGVRAQTGDSFSISDRNGDGYIDRGEFHDRMTEVFFFADRDRDGRLSPEELPDVAAAAFAVADRDGDGALSLPEFTGARTIDFDRADADRDGLLSRVEVEAASPAPRPEVRRGRVSPPQPIV